MPMGRQPERRLVAEIKMRREGHAGSFLVLEGADDREFWHSRHHGLCQLLIANGKDNVIHGIRQLDGQSIEGVLGIVDSDYDMLMGHSYESTNLVATDGHDLECLLCRSAALDEVLSKYGDAAKISRFESKEGDVRGCVLDRATFFGRLRWAALRYDDSVGLGEISVLDFIDVDTWQVNRDGLLRTIESRSLDGAWQQRIAGLPEADPWHVAHGKDMVLILWIGLRKVLGGIGSKVGVTEITKILRQEMPWRDLEATALYADIRQWETANAPYAVLAAQSGGHA